MNCFCFVDRNGPHDEARKCSAPFDVAMCYSRSYLRIRLCVFCGIKVRNLHLCAIPMLERDIGDHKFDLFSTLFDVLDSEWKRNIVAVLTDGATSRV
jgi:hypothetical protein